MNDRRQLTIAIVGCAAGAGLALFASSRTWLVTQTVRAAPQPPLVTDRSGVDITPLLPALAWVALAAAGGVLATRSLARVVVAVAMLLAGLGVGVEAVRIAAGTDGVRAVWPTLCVIGALLVVAAAALTLYGGRRWPAMGARYERARPQHRPASSDDAPDGSAAQMWDAIDHGLDPTRSEDQDE